MQTLDEPQATQSTEVSALIDASTEGAVDTGVNLANSVVAIVKEVGEMLGSVPYVKALSGVVLQIIKIRDEIKSNKERCREIIEKVLRISKSIYERLAEVAKSEGREKLTRLEGHLGDCKSTLSAVCVALEKHRSRKPFAKLINRGVDELNMLDRRVDELNIKLILDILVDIKLEQAVSAANVNQSTAPNPAIDSPDHVLPPKPHLLVERKDQVKIAINVLLGEESSRVAIIGGGGFGKTTLARTILHDPKIVERYQLRYFLSCEGMPNIDSLLAEFGSMLGLKTAPPAVLASARRLLGMSTTLLCFDNFETPWEAFDTRTKVEELLESIADIPNLSLIITMRGEQRPSKVAWSRPLLPPLPTLSLDGAKEILHKIASDHTANDFTLQLLQAIDGIPLAITLVATLLRDGESSESLWGRWSTNYTQVIHTGGDDRQSNLNRSIALSVYSLRMNEDADSSRQVLAALSLLPNGFPLNKEAIDSLQKHFNGFVGFADNTTRRFPKLRKMLKRFIPVQANQRVRDTAGMPVKCSGINDLHTIIDTLRTVALIAVDDTGTSPRIQMLSPIRLFCNQWLSSETSQALERVANYYISILLHAAADVDNPELYAQVIPEIQNAHSVFQQVYKVGYSRDISGLIEATSYLTNWSQYIGYLSQDTIQMALQSSVNYPIPHAKCLVSLAELYYTEGQDTRAETYFREAAALFKHGNVIKGEARALKRCGDILIYMGPLEKAEDLLNEALELYTQADDKHGQADVRFSLGKMYRSKNLYSKADTTLTGALEAYKQIPDLIGQANAAQGLSDLHFTFSDLVKAKKFAAESLDTAKQAHYALGEGNALQALGHIHLVLDRVPDARQSLKQALLIYKQQSDSISQLNVINNLAQVYIQSDQLSAAEALLTTSSIMELDVIQIPNILTTLGWLYICADRFDKAEPVLDNALQRFQKFNHKDWHDSVLAHIGTVYLKSNRLCGAEQILKSIPNLNPPRKVKIQQLWALGNLYLIRGEFDDAEASLNLAMAHCQNRGWSYSYQQGNILRSMGTLHMKQGCVDHAIQAFKQAREFHRKAQWVSEQATDLKQLGEAYNMFERTEEAAAAFKESDELMDSVREARTLKN